jgi:hypothetical protein
VKSNEAAFANRASAFFHAWPLGAKAAPLHELAGMHRAAKRGFGGHSRRERPPAYRAWKRNLMFFLAGAAARSI